MKTAIPTVRSTLCRAGAPWRHPRRICSALFLAWVVAVVQAQSIYEPYTISTLAGQIQTAGGADGTGAEARFNFPRAVAVDANGVLYVADSNNHAIRKILPGGAVTTFAGKMGESGSTDGIGANARFFVPYGITMDALGNLYVADSFGSTIRKITPDAVVTTIAGYPGTTGHVDGVAGAARFNLAFSLTVDFLGNIYVAEEQNQTIRKITPAGVVTTLAGLAGVQGSADGTGTAARFNAPAGIAVDGEGNLYVTDGGNHTIRKISPLGVVTTYAGAVGARASNDGPVAESRFSFPSGIAFDRYGYLYVTESNNRTIRRISPSGQVTTLAGTPQRYAYVDGTGPSAEFRLPIGIAVDAQRNLYFAEGIDHTIRKGVPQPSHLTALSVRSNAGTGSETLIAGLVITGSGSKNMVVRGVGPGLAQLNVAGPMSDPQLRLFNSSGLELKNNDDWDGSDLLRATFAAVGLAPLSVGSKDAAMISTLSAGVYTTHLVAKSGPGVALIELYDYGSLTDSNRLSALSVRSMVGVGDNILIVGLVVSSGGPKTLVIRGLGPALAAQGVAGVLADPQLGLYSGTTLVAANDNWIAGGPTLGAAFTTVGLGPLPLNAKDAALLVTLLPGVYTVQLSGVNSTTGVGLIEMYEVP